MSELVLDALDAIYKTATRPEEWPQALTAIAKCFDDVGALLIYQRDDGSFATIVSPSLVEAQADYQSYWWRASRGLFLSSPASGAEPRNAPSVGAAILAALAA